jgi:peptidoglycan/LPS O-acetylase OafA/YrhL
MENRRFYSLDGLRGICALSVVLYHSELLVRPGVIVCHGYLAVDMFFLLSGFVISTSYDARFAAGLGAFSFLKARIRRLAPVYWGGLTLCVAAALLHRWYMPGIAPGKILVLGMMAAVLVPVLGPGTFAYPANSVAWTLLWELVVNFAYASGLRRLSSKQMAVLAALLLIPTIAFASINPRGWSFGMTGLDLEFAGLRAIPEFLIGALIHRAWRQGMLDRLPDVSPMLPLLVWMAFAVLPQGLPVLVDAVAALLVCPLVLALLVRGDHRAPAWFAPLGAISYSLYASHLAWIDLAQHTPLFGLNRHPSPVLAAGMMAVAVTGAWVLYRLCDPARRAKVPKDHAFREFPGPRTACEAQPDSV